MSKITSPSLQMNSFTKYLETFIFLSFLRKCKHFLPLLFEVFWMDIMRIFDDVKMNSVLKMNFLSNIDPYPIPVINIKNSYL